MQSSAKKIRKIWQSLGPGFTTGAADDDPSGIATYSQAGSQFGLTLLWMALYSFPLMAVVQEMCARLGLVTGKGLAALIRREFSRPVMYFVTFLLVVANVLNIGADLGAVASAIQLFVPNASFELLVVLITFASLVIQIYLPFHVYAKYLKWLALALIAYLLVALSLNLEATSLLRMTFLPSITITRETILMICAILGTTISPYLFFWQTSQEVEELSEKRVKNEQSMRREIRRMRMDVLFGMFFSNLIMFSIILTAGSTLFINGGVEIETAADAAKALSPLLGRFSYTIFSLGIIGTGLLAIPILAGSASYAVTEALGLRGGLSKQWYQAIPFYSFLVLAMVLGVVFTFLGISPMKGLFYSAVVNGVISPVMLVFIVKLSSNPRLMGKHVNGVIMKTLGWGVTGVMAIVAVLVLVFSFA